MLWYSALKSISTIKSNKLWQWLFKSERLALLVETSGIFSRKENGVFETPLFYFCVHFIFFYWQQNDSFIYFFLYSLTLGVSAIHAILFDCNFTNRPWCCYKLTQVIFYWTKIVPYKILRSIENPPRWRPTPYKIGKKWSN